MSAPPMENEYRACPAFGVRLYSLARLSTRGGRPIVTITLQSPRRG
jgi:hypothetical protein